MQSRMRERVCWVGRRERLYCTVICYTLVVKHLDDAV